MFKKDVLKRIVSFVLVLTLLVCAAACMEKDYRRPSRQDGSEDHHPGQTTRPTVYPNDLKPEDYTLEYTLTQFQIDEFYRLLRECEDLIDDEAPEDTVRAAVAAMEDSFDVLSAQRNTVMVLHYNHTMDEETEERYLDSVDIVSDAYDAYLQMCRRVYQSNSKVKAVLFEDWSETEVKCLLKYEKRVTDLEKRNAQIEVEYRTAGDDDERIELYIELVQNNNEIARIYGYDNYYDYAYEVVYGRDYDAASVEQLRAYARAYLAYILPTAEDNFRASQEAMGYAQYYQMVDFVQNDYNTLSVNYVADYIAAAPQNLAAAMQTMLDRDSMFGNSYDSDEGAFTINLGNRPFCYFGPGYAKSNTVIHEGGHYYAALYTPIADVPLDLAEVHSQANEWLFIRFLEGKMDEKVLQTVIDYNIYDNVGMMIVCLIVDEFEQRVYAADVSGFTAEDFDAIMDDVVYGYGVSLPTDMNNYWRHVVVEQPVYYISYAVSGMAAMSLYTMAQDDYDGAMAVYQTLCERFDMDAKFLGNLQAVGLYTPFDEGFYQELERMVNS